MKKFIYFTTNIYVFSIIAVLSTILLGACAHYIGSSDNFYGISRGTPPHAFIIDISGSMGSGVGDTARSNIMHNTINRVEKEAGNIRTGVGALDSIINGAKRSIFESTRAETTKLAEALRQLIPFIKGLPDGSRFSITAFNSNYQRFGTGGISATQLTRAQAIDFVSAFDAKGGTELLPPLKEILNERPATIYLVSDGKPSESDYTILKMARIANANGIVINTIGVGDDQNQNLLRDIAQITGGVYSPQNISIPFGTGLLKNIYK